MGTLYDVAFLAWGAVMVVVGAVILRGAESATARVEPDLSPLPTLTGGP